MFKIPSFMNPSESAPKFNYLILASKKLLEILACLVSNKTW